MNRILSLIGVVLVVGCGPEPRDLETLLRNDVEESFMDPVDGQPYSGPWFLIEDGMRSTGSLRDGKWDGPIEVYHENGQLQLSWTFKDGVRDGPYEEYHENGQLSRKGTYKDGILDGPLEYYHENGQLGVKGTFKDRERCGEWLEDGETVTYDPCPPGN